MTWAKIADLPEGPALYRILELTEDDRFSTPLVDAVRGISRLSLQVALDLYPGSVNDADCGGQTALHWAVEMGDLDAVQSLISYKADLSTTAYYANTALHFAATKSDSLFVEVLLKAGSDSTAETRYGETPLHAAAWCLARDCVVALLRAGCRADAKSGSGNNAFHLAASSISQTIYSPFPTISNTEEDMLLIFQSLVEYGGDPNGTAHSGHRPLDTAIRKNNGPAYRALRRLGVEVDYQDKAGWTILHRAAYWARHELLASLLEMELSTIDPDLADCNGETATDIFQVRLDTPWADLHPEQSTPTEKESILFERLVADMRRRYRANVSSGSEDSESAESSDSEEEDWFDAEATT